MLLRYLVWLAVPLLALIELGAHAYFAGRVPDADEWQATLGEEIGRLKQGNELLVAAPYWSEPNLRHALGDDLMPLRDVARPDEETYARAIEVSVAGERAPELQGWKQVSHQQLGAFDVYVMDNPEPHPALFDFVDNLAPEHASASFRRGSNYKDCSWNPKAKVSNGALDFGHPTFPRQRFECGGADWSFVGVTVLEDEGYRGRRCIWAQPTTPGATRVSYPDVPLGSTIKGYLALPYWVERWAKGGVVSIEVKVDGESLGQFEHEEGEGWKPFQVSTAAYTGRKAPVEFVLTAEPGSQRQACFYARAQ